jgi:hypothetical protein
MTRPPKRLASSTRSNSRSLARFGATTRTVSLRRTADSRSMVTARWARAATGGVHLTQVGISSGRPEDCASSARWATKCHGSHSGVPTTRSESRLSEPDPRAAANSAEASSRWRARRSLRNPLTSWWSMPSASDRRPVSLKKRPNFGWSGQIPTPPRSREHQLSRDTPYSSRQFHSPSTAHKLTSGGPGASARRGVDIGDDTLAGWLVHFGPRRLWSRGAALVQTEGAPS